MPLQILALEVKDFEQLVHHADFGSPGDDCVAPPNPVAWPVTTRTEAQLRARCIFALQKRRLLNDPTVHFLKVVDTEGGTSNTNGLDNIIAVARWHYFPNGYDYDHEAHWEMAPETSTPLLPYLAVDQDSDSLSASYPPPNFKLALHNYILSDRDAFRSNWIPKGKPCWILMHLTTRFSHRKRGAAALLIQWGLAKAAENNVPAYLEAGVAGRPIYERYGFEQVGELRELDLAAYGMDAKFELTNMRYVP
jgi:hypothetical protein